MSRPATSRLKVNPRRTPRVAEIRAIVCRHFDVTNDEIVSQARAQRITRPRLIGMHLARQMTWQSSRQIARQFGRADHATALHADRRIKAMRASDPAFNAQIRAVVADVHRATRETAL